VPRFRLLTTSGDDLGLFQVPAPDWSEGDRIHRRAGNDLVVVRVVPAEAGDDVAGYLVVEPAA
jgi:hypothetical protein